MLLASYPNDSNTEDWYYTTSVPKYNILQNVSIEGPLFKEAATQMRRGKYYIFLHSQKKEWKVY